MQGLISDTGFAYDDGRGFERLDDLDEIETESESNQ